jgi:hypothetical protein
MDVMEAFSMPESDFTSWTEDFEEYDFYAGIDFDNDDFDYYVYDYDGYSWYDDYWNNEDYDLINYDYISSEDLDDTKEEASSFIDSVVDFFSW